MIEMTAIPPISLKNYQKAIATPPILCPVFGIYTGAGEFVPSSELAEIVGLTDRAFYE